MKPPPKPTSERGGSVSDLNTAVLASRQQQKMQIKY